MKKKDKTEVNDIREIKIILIIITASLVIYTLFLIPIVFYVQKVKNGLIRFNP